MQQEVANVPADGSVTRLRVDVFKLKGGPFTKKKLC